MLEAGAKVRNLRDVKWCSIEDGKPGKGTGRHIAAFILDTPNSQADARAAVDAVWGERMTFRLEVRGIPKAQARARAFAFKKGERTHVRMYDPETSRDWKRTVAHEAALAWAQPPLSGPVMVDLRFALPRPKSLPKRVLHHVKKPDLDNLAKAVKDALRGIVYNDDSQVVCLKVSKAYSPTPGVQIFVSTMED